jgi:hypothetical protein
MRMAMRLFLPALLGLMIIPVVAQADSYSPYKFEVLQGLTQSGDTVLTATIESVTVGQRGDVYRDTTDTQVKCSVREVYVGPKTLKQRTVNVVFGAGDEPLKDPSTSPVLLILKREGDNYRLCFFHRYGVFRIENGGIPVWFEGKPFGSNYTVKEILAHIKSYAKAKVEMISEVPDNLLLDDGYLPIKFSFKNTGKVPVLLLPPSYCFNSFAVKRVVTDRNEMEKTWWESVDHWGFLSQSEPLVELKVGAERSFSYRIPFTVLKIAAAGNYRASFDYHPYQLSQWATKANLTEKQMRRVWLGVPKQTFTIVSIKS